MNRNLYITQSFNSNRPTQRNGLEKTRILEGAISMNGEIEILQLHPNMEILGSFIACINELCASLTDDTADIEH